MSLLAVHVRRLCCFARKAACVRKCCILEVKRRMEELIGENGGINWREVFWNFAPLSLEAALPLLSRQPWKITTQLFLDALASPEEPFVTDSLAH